MSPLRQVSSPGVLTAPKLIEASGVVRSTRQPNVFWSQNDSGNDERIFAYDSTGAALGMLRIAGARNRDWEAIALGPCPDGTCLFIGDVGDNNARRSDVTIWRIPEPVPADTLSPRAVPLRFGYAEGPRDVEAMWIAPDSAVLLLTKRPIRARGGRDRWSLIYRLPPAAWRSDARATATLVDSVPLVPTASNPTNWITDASLSSADAKGVRHLAVRTYAAVYIFDADGVSGRPTALRHQCNLRALHEQYGEGVTWLADGRLLFVAEGRASVLHAARCDGP